MSRLKILVPDQHAGTPDTVPVHLKELKAWVDALPTADSVEAARRTLAALQELNHCRIAVMERYQLLELLAPLVDALSTGLKKSYLGTAFPLNDKKAANAALVEQLYAGLATGYKIIVVEIVATTTSRESPGQLLAGTIYHAMAYLSRWLVESYIVYAPEPPSVWFELHQLYSYAQQNGLLEHEVSVAEQGAPITILGAYKRIMMLALANPYQLMQGEVADAFKYIAMWTEHCRLLPLDQPAPTGVEFVVDLDTDKPPGYAHAGSAPPPRNGRRLDLSSLVNVVNTHAQAIAARSSKAGTQQNNIFERRKRGLYLRIAQAWAVRSERMSQRSPHDKQLAIIIGLTNCHYLMSGGAEFSPEVDEIEMSKGSLESGSAESLTLIDTDQTPWLQDDQTARIELGINKPRTSKFGNPEEVGKDIWEKIFATPTQQQQQITTSSAAIVPFLCRQQCVSGNGFDAECDIDNRMQLRVGDLITYQLKDAPDNEWNIGAIVWLKSTSQRKLTFGINRLAEDASAVATKALRGVGAGGEYYRALLTPKLDPREHPTTLITPAAVYDVGSIVMINTKMELIYVRLTKLIENTHSFSRFRFEITEKPQSVADKIKDTRVI